MPEIIERIISIITENLLMPAILIIIPLVLIKVESYAKNLLTSTKEKNDKESLDAVTNVMHNLLDQVKTIVRAAVAANMKAANDLKADNTHQLTDEEIKMLNDSARSLAYKMLPKNLTEGSFLVLLGGAEALEALIDSLIENELIELKKK